MLTEKEIRFILNKLNPEFGYSADPEIRSLEIRLSIMLQMVCDKKADNNPIQRSVKRYAR